MYNMFIFDLDNTLVASDALEDLRGAKYVNNTSDEYAQSIRDAIDNEGVGYLLDQLFIHDLQKKYPKAKFGVFTTSPRFYAKTVLRHLYAPIKWDAVIGFEDVKKTKPNPEGIINACNIADPVEQWEANTIVIIGDSEKDIKAAYASGVTCILYSAGWPQRMRTEDYRANNLLPDMSVKTPHTLKEVISEPDKKMLILEAMIANPNTESIRAPKISHFSRLDKLDGTEKNKRFNVTTLGRMFSEYESLRNRRAWHSLTQQIHKHKNSTIFPNAWINAIRRVIELDIEKRWGRGKFVITCIPHKKNRTPRLESLITQLADSHTNQPIYNSNISFNPKILKYKDGALSHHGQHLDADSRFKNVRDNLVVNNAIDIDDCIIYVIDDVVTSGATLYYAQEYLNAAGAGEVVCIALAQAIGE